MGDPDVQVDGSQGLSVGTDPTIIDELKKITNGRSNAIRVLEDIGALGRVDLYNPNETDDVYRPSEWLNERMLIEVDESIFIKIRII